MKYFIYENVNRETARLLISFAINLFDGEYIF